LSDLRTILH